MIIVFFVLLLGNAIIKETNKTGPNFYMQEVVVKNSGNSADGSLKDFGNFSPFLLGGEPMVSRYNGVIRLQKQQQRNT